MDYDFEPSPCIYKPIVRKILPIRSRWDAMLGDDDRGGPEGHAVLYGCMLAVARHMRQDIETTVHLLAEGDWARTVGAVAAFEQRLRDAARDPSLFLWIVRGP